MLEPPGIGLSLDQRRLELQGRVGVARDRCFYARGIVGAEDVVCRWLVESLRASTMIR